MTVTDEEFNNLSSEVGDIDDRVTLLETEIGVQPQGPYATTRARLDILEARISTAISGPAGGDLGGNYPDPVVIGLQGSPVSSTAPSTGQVLLWNGSVWTPGSIGSGFTAGGDLSGNSSSQVVIGLQSRSVLSTAPLSNQFLGWTGAAWAPETITQDIILDGFSVFLFGGGFVELGQTVANPSFTATYNRVSATAVLTDTEGNTLDVTSTPTSFNSNGTFQKTVFNDSVVFVLTANDALNTAVFKTSNAVMSWVQNSYYGVGPAGQNTAAFIQSLTGFLTNVRGTVFSVTAGPTDKVYFACRAAYGAPTFIVGGFAGGFTLVSNTISVTNTYGIIEDYELYESDNLNLGSITVTVS